MKKMFLAIAIFTILAACNSGNEGSASIPIDSLRISDSTRLADSLRMIDTTNRMLNSDTNQQ